MALPEPVKQNSDSEYAFWKQVRNENGDRLMLDAYMQSFPKEADFYKDLLLQYKESSVADILLEALVDPAKPVMGEFRKAESGQAKPAEPTPMTMPTVTPTMPTTSEIEQATLGGMQATAQLGSYLARQQSISEGLRPEPKPPSVLEQMGKQDVTPDEVVAKYDIPKGADWERWWRDQLKAKYYPDNEIEHIIGMMQQGKIPILATSQNIPEWQETYSMHGGLTGDFYAYVPIKDRLSAMKVFVSSMRYYPKEYVASILSSTQGWRGATINHKDRFDRWIGDSAGNIDRASSELAEKYKNKQAFLGMKINEIPQFIKSLATSTATMGPALAAGTAAGVGTAMLPVPGARAAAGTVGRAAGAATLGVAAYNMASYEIMQEYLELKDAEMVQERGYGITPEEEKKLKADFADEARRVGLWEAIPEVVSGAIAFEALAAPLTKIAGKTMGSRILAGIAKSGVRGSSVMLGEWIPEATTWMGQNATLADSDFPNVKQVDWGNPDDWVDALKAVAPQTFALTLALGAVGKAGRVITRGGQAITRASIAVDIYKRLNSEVGTKDPYHEPIKQVVDKVVAGDQQTMQEIEQRAEAPLGIDSRVAVRSRGMNGTITNMSEYATMVRLDNGENITVPTTDIYPTSVALPGDTTQQDIVTPPEEVGQTMMPIEEVPVAETPPEMPIQIPEEMTPAQPEVAPEPTIPEHPLASIRNDYNNGFLDQDGINKFIRVHKPIRFGAVNAMARVRNTNEPPVFKIATDGNYYAVMLEDKTYAVLPRYFLTIQEETMGPGGMREVFDFPEYDPAELYNDVKVIEPAIFTLAGNTFTLKYKGELSTTRTPRPTEAIPEAPAAPEQPAEVLVTPSPTPPPAVVEGKTTPTEPQFIDKSPPIGLGIRQTIPENVTVIEEPKDMTGFKAQFLRWITPVRTIVDLYNNPVTIELARLGRDTVDGMSAQMAHYANTIDAIYKPLSKEQGRQLVDYLEQGEIPDTESEEMKTAYQQVDDIRKEIYDMIKDEMQIDISKWSIPPEQYWPHIFVGRYQVKVKAGIDEKGNIKWRTIDGGFAKNLGDAIDIAKAYEAAHPNAEFQVGPKDLKFDYHPTLLSRRAFWRFKSEIQKATQLDHQEVMSLLHGKAAIKPRGKFVGNFSKRDVNLGGYIKDPIALKIYINRVLRKKWLDPYRRRATELTEQLPPGLKAYFEELIDDVSGKYNPYNNHYIFTKAVSGITRWESRLKLAYRPVTAAVNRLQPTQLAFPEIGTYLWRGWWKKRTDWGQDIIERSGVHGQLPKYASGEALYSITPKERIYKPLGLFSRAEMANREDTVVGGYLFAQKIFEMDRATASKRGYDYVLKYLDTYKNKDIASLEYAKDLNTQVNFIYNNADLPKIFRTDVGRVAFQFKTYPINYLATTMKWVLQKPDNIHYWTRLGRMIVTNIGLAGVRTTPYIGRTAWKALVLSPIIFAFLPEDTRDEAKRIIGRGIFTMAGVDLSQRLGPNEFVPTTFKELGGPFISDLVNLYNFSNNDMDWNEFVKLSPLVRDINTAIRDDIIDQRGRKIAEKSGLETFFQAMGVPLEKVTVSRDFASIEAKLKREHIKARAKYVDRAIDDLRDKGVLEDINATPKMAWDAVKKTALDAFNEGIFPMKKEFTTAIDDELERRALPTVIRVFKTSPTAMREEQLERLRQIDKVHRILPRE